MPLKRLTLKEVAEMSGLSYARIYQMVSRGDLAVDAENTVALADARNVKRRPKADGPRDAIMLRPAKSRAERWRAAAGDRPVSTWLGDLADVASGWTGGGEDQQGAQPRAGAAGRRRGSGRKA